MHRIFDSRFQTDRVLLGPGEYLATRESVVLHTVLGSCVAVCLYVPDLRYGGMNHFMLPTAHDPSTVFYTDAGRYGMHAMELLINEMLALGINRSQLTAKVFGGGHVLANGADSRLPDSNIAFALEYLAAESIPVVSKDVGGWAGRQIQFYLQNGVVYVKKLNEATRPRIARRERQYSMTIPPPKDVEIFDSPGPSSRRWRDES